MFGAEEIFRAPAEGPAFYLGLRIGDTDFGLVAKENPGTGAASRILLSIGVDDVDETLGRVEALGGSVRGGPNDMPWGQHCAHISGSGSGCSGYGRRAVSPSSLSSRSWRVRPSRNT